MKKLYVGTYSNEINIYNIDNDELTKIGISEIRNASYLFINNQKLYSVLETNDFNGYGGVAAFSIEENGFLKLLNIKTNNGKSPCHLCGNNKFLFTANYSDGSISQFSLLETGEISDLIEVYKHEGSGPNKLRQDSSHVHHVSFIDDSNYLSAVDLGIDKIMIYQIDKDKKLNKNHEISLPPGSGPRHLTYYKNYFYLINELNNTIIVIRNDNYQFEIIQQISTLPKDFDGESYASGIKIKDGFLYASNRGHDSITVYKISDDGLLNYLDNYHTEGCWPRDFVVDEDYLFVGNERSNQISTFKRLSTGKLQFLHNHTYVNHPVCLVIMDL